MSEPYYSQRARSVCVSLSVFSFSFCVLLHGTCPLMSFHMITERRIETIGSPNLVHALTLWYVAVDEILDSDGEISSLQS